MARKGKERCQNPLLAQYKGPDTFSVPLRCREELIALAKEIQNNMDRGDDCALLIDELQQKVPYPQVRGLFVSDYPPDLIVDYALGWRPNWPQLTRGQLVTVVERIMRAEGTEAEIKVLIDQFDANCKHPAKNGLIYYPEKYFGGALEPSAAEIVAMAMSPGDDRTRCESQPGS